MRVKLAYAAELLLWGVNFVPPTGRPSWGVTDAAGAFKLGQDRKTEGVIPGKQRVYFTYRPRDPKQEIAYQEGKAPLPRELKPILAKYGSLEKTTLSYDVNQDGQIIDITLD